MSRVRLPNRRRHLLETMKWEGRRWEVCVGFNEQGLAREVFVDGVKVGSELEALVNDACVVISLLLQSGMPAVELARHLAREGIAAGAPVASVLGAAVERIVALEVAALKMEPPGKESK